MTEFWKMMGWLIRERLWIFLIVCAAVSLWLGAAAMILEHAISTAVAKWTAHRERVKYRDYVRFSGFDWTEWEE